jgi:hypothetical protein
MNSRRSSAGKHQSWRQSKWHTPSEEVRPCHPVRLDSTNSEGRDCAVLAASYLRSGLPLRQICVAFSESGRIVSNPERAGDGTWFRTDDRQYGNNARGLSPGDHHRAETSVLPTTHPEPITIRNRVDGGRVPDHPTKLRQPSMTCDECHKRFPRACGIVSHPFPRMLCGGPLVSARSGPLFSAMVGIRKFAWSDGSFCRFRGAAKSQLPI